MLAARTLRVSFGCYYEEKILPVEDVVFFGRFIDDVLVAVYANSEAEALRKCSVIKYDSLDLEWSASETSMPFLDLLVYIDQGTGRIQHKPYRKMQNHLERIPWVSNHPKDIKKETFVREMSRLATLSSTHANYLEALDHLSMIYIARGYPPDLIKSWLKDNTSRRWQNRLGKSEPVGDVFVLKTHFNPVWNSFNIHELGQTVINRWLRYLHSQDDRNHQFDRHSRYTLVGGRPVDEYVDLETDGPNPRVRSPSPPTPDEIGNTEPWKVGSQDPSNHAAGADSTPAPSTEADVFIQTLRKIGHKSHIERVKILDTRKLGFHERKWLVSRKRNFNLADLVSKIKQSVLYQLPYIDENEDGNVDTWD